MTIFLDTLLTVALLVGIFASFVYLLGAGFAAWIAYRSEQ